MSQQAKLLPYGGMDTIANVIGRFGDKVQDDSDVARGEASLIVAVDALRDVMTYLRNNSQCLFSSLMDICGADYPQRAERFDIVYHLLSIEHNMRIRLKVRADAETIVPSLVDIWASAGWFERECWDMYGVFFAEHPDLRRILTDYGFSGHPLRKDFPLTGYTEVRYNDELARVVHEPVALNADYRDFDFESPWEAVGDLPIRDNKSGNGDNQKDGGK